MRYQRGETELGLLGSLILFAIVLAVLWVWEAAACSAKWKGTFKTSYGPIQGCRIQMQDGKWIPEERYREIEQ